MIRSAFRPTRMLWISPLSLGGFRKAKSFGETFPESNMSDHKDLKAWAHWKKREKGLTEDDALFVKAVEDAISQAGMVPKLRTQLAETQNVIADQAKELKDMAMRLIEKDWPEAQLNLKLSIATEALKLIAAPKRPDGTYNRCRESCERLAAETLKRLAGKGSASDGL